MANAANYQLLVRIENIEWSSEIVQYKANSPTRSALLQSHPNPFNPATRLRFSLSEASDVRLRVLDLSGRVVRTFQLQDLPSGRHSVLWNGQDDRGHSVASGTYVVEFEDGTTQDSGRVTLLK